MKTSKKKLHAVKNVKSEKAGKKKGVKKEISGKRPSRVSSNKETALSTTCSKKVLPNKIKRGKISPVRKQQLKKIITGLGEELLFIQEKIEKAKRDEWIGTVNDEIDNAVASTERDILFERVDKFVQRLDEIENALKKAELKRFGVCEKCGREISIKRLNLIPYARYCYRCISN